jgi:hypothetical protein
MPAIRLAEIPNAGPRAATASTAGIAAPSVPRFQVNPEVAKLGGAAMVDSGSMRNAAQSMLTQTLELDAFSQEAKAAANFADSIQGIGNVAMEWGQKFARAKDDADIERAQTIMQATWQKQLTEQEGLPVEKWQENWARNQEQAQRALGEIKFSQNAASRLGPELDRWSTISSVNIDGKAKQKQVESFRLDAEVAYKRELANDNLGGAFSVIDRFEKNGTLSADDAERFRFNVELESIKKSKAERNANIESAIILDPQKWEEDLTQGIKSGSSKLQTDLSKEEMLRFLGNARQQSRFAEVEKLSAVEDVMLKGEFQSVEELEKALDRPDLMPNVKLPERAVQSLKASFLQSPERQAESIKLLPAIIQKIEAFDVSSDSKLENYFDLASEIRSLPEGYRREPLDLLYDKFRQYKDGRKPVPATALGQIKKQAADDLKNGGFGKWKTGKDGAIPDDQRPGYIAANLRFSQEMTSLENWAKANPDKAKVDTEVYKAHNEIITELNKVDAAAGRPSTRRPVEIPSISKPPANPSGIPDPDEILRSAPAGASAPATIRHNNPGGIYPSGLASKYGSTGSSTIGGGHKIASFRTPTDGAAAQFAQLNRPQYLGKPLREAIRTWSGGNSVDSYLATIQREAGISPDTVLTPALLADPAVAIPLAKAMARHETGRQFPLDDTGWRQAHSRVFST